LVGKVDKKSKEPWITQETTNKKGEWGNWKKVNNEKGRKSCRRLRNELKRATDKPRRTILRDCVTRSWNFMNRTLWLNVHEDELGWNENIGTHKIGIETCQRYIILDRRKICVLKIWEKNISELNDRSNRPEHLEVWTEEEVGRHEERP
jgi:hypothetical protein